MSIYEHTSLLNSLPQFWPEACKSSTDPGGVLQYAGKMDLIVLKQAILFQDPSQL